MGARRRGCRARGWCRCEYFIFSLWSAIVGREGEGELYAASTDGAAGQRMIQYLNRSIQLEHFETMKRMGFNYVRLPLGYWNVVQPTEAPDAPNSTASRWR